MNWAIYFTVGFVAGVVLGVALIILKGHRSSGTIVFFKNYDGSVGMRLSHVKRGFVRGVQKNGKVLLDIHTVGDGSYFAENLLPFMDESHTK